MWQLPADLKPEEILDYLRKSRTDDPRMTVAEVLSKHEQMLDDWVERNLPGLGKVPEENRYREVVSGETLDSRPKMQEALRRIESQEVRAILCVEPQRLSRGDMEDIGRLVKLLRYTNTLVITLPYTYDLRDERDRDLFERELKRGNEFLEYQKRIQQNGRLLSVENGNFIGNFAPYGYKKVTIKEGKRKCHTLEPDPETAPIVKMMFEWYRDGMGSHRIARKLNEMGIPSYFGRKWTAASLAKTFSNVHYIGKVRWEHRKTTKTVEDGEIITSRPMNKDCLIYPGKHPAIIDQELWDAVQEMRGKIPPVKKRSKCSNPFAGIVYCQCGTSMARRQYMRNGVERTAPRLLCDNQTECGTASCFVSEMMDEVVKILKDAIADFELKVKQESTDTMEIHRQAVQRLEKRLAELEALEVAQWEKYTLDAMPKHVFDLLNKKVLDEKAEVQEALCVAKDSIPEPIDYEAKRALFSEALELLQDPDAPALQQNLLLKQCIDRIIYRRQKKKFNGNRRWGDPEPMQLEVHLRV